MIRDHQVISLLRNSLKMMDFSQEINRFIKSVERRNIALWLEFCIIRLLEVMNLKITQFKL